MRQLKRRRINDFIAAKNQIEVDRPRRVAGAGRGPATYSAKIELDREQFIEQFLCAQSQSGLDYCDGVAESWRLVAKPNSRRRINTRQAGCAARKGLQPASRLTNELGRRVASMRQIRA
jgi:hypothetical protein